jgi:hypothetical protein
VAILGGRADGDSGYCGDPLDCCPICGYPLDVHGGLDTRWRAGFGDHYDRVMDPLRLARLAGEQPSTEDAMRALGAAFGALPAGWVAECARLWNVESDMLAAEAEAQRRERRELHRAERRNRLWEEGLLP